MSGYQQAVISQLSVIIHQADQRFVLILGNQVNFVQDQDGLNTLAFSRDQVTIYQVGMGFRKRGYDNSNTVDIGCNRSQFTAVVGSA